MRTNEFSTMRTMPEQYRQDEDSAFSSKPPGASEIKGIDLVWGN